MKKCFSVEIKKNIGINMIFESLKLTFFIRKHCINICLKNLLRNDLLSKETNNNKINMNYTRYNAAFPFFWVLLFI